MATAATASTSLPTKEHDTTDMSNKDEEISPTVDVDSLDLSLLSLNGKGETNLPSESPKRRNADAGVTTQQVPAQSLADRISSGEVGNENTKNEAVDEANATAIHTEAKLEVKEIQEPGTNLLQSKYEVAVKLQDLQADPNSPLYSVKSFDELGLYNTI